MRIADHLIDRINYLLSWNVRGSTNVLTATDALHALRATARCAPRRAPPPPTRRCNDSCKWQRYRGEAISSAVRRGGATPLRRPAVWVGLMPVSRTFAFFSLSRNLNATD
jgi:hypothetical protein